MLEVEHELVSASRVQTVVRAPVYDVHGYRGQPGRFLKAGDVLGCTDLNRRTKEDRGRLQLGEFRPVREGDRRVRGNRPEEREVHTHGLTNEHVLDTLALPEQVDPEGHAPTDQRLREFRRKQPVQPSELVDTGLATNTFLEWIGGQVGQTPSELESSRPAVEVSARPTPFNVPALQGAPSPTEAHTVNLRLGDLNLEWDYVVGHDTPWIHRLDDRGPLNHLDGEQITLGLDGTHFGIFLPLLEREELANHVIAEFLVSAEGDGPEKGIRPRFDFERHVRLVGILRRQTHRTGYVGPGVPAVSEPLDQRVPGGGEIDLIEQSTHLDRKVRGRIKIFEDVGPFHRQAGDSDG